MGRSVSALKGEPPPTRKDQDADPDQTQTRARPEPALEKAMGSEMLHVPRDTANFLLEVTKQRSQTLHDFLSSVSGPW